MLEVSDDGGKRYVDNFFRDNDESKYNFCVISQKYSVIFALAGVIIMYPLSLLVVQTIVVLLNAYSLFPPFPFKLSPSSYQPVRRVGVTSNLI